MIVEISRKDIQSSTREWFELDSLIFSAIYKKTGNCMISAIAHFLANSEGLKNVMVTNGMAELAVLEELSPYIDAMNIDLKGFTDRYYNKDLSGNRQQVMAFIEAAVKTCHVELTTLIVPGENDGEEEMRKLSRWVSRL